MFANFAQMHYIVPLLQHVGLPKSLLQTLLCISVAVANHEPLINDTFHIGLTQEHQDETVDRVVVAILARKQKEHVQAGLDVIRWE